MGWKAISPRTGATVTRLRDRVLRPPVDPRGRLAAVPAPAPILDPSALVPAQAHETYEMRDVARAISDTGSVLELDGESAMNMVTALARIEGRSVGVIANQPRRLGGAIDVHAAEKGAQFVDICNHLGVPLLALVDTPGFMPSEDREALGIVRHGASLVRAFAGASVLRLTVVLRRAHGGAGITMNSKALGADAVYAWPGAEIGSIAATEAGGLVDEVIQPGETRHRLAWALSAGPLR